MPGAIKKNRLAALRPKWRRSHLLSALGGKCNFVPGATLFPAGESERQRFGGDRWIARVINTSSWNRPWLMNMEWWRGQMSERGGQVTGTNWQQRRLFVSKQNKLSSFNIISYIFIASNSPSSLAFFFSAVVCIARHVTALPYLTFPGLSACSGFVQRGTAAWPFSVCVHLVCPLRISVAQ